MRRTLFHIPPEIDGISVLGFGWALGIWFIISVVVFLLTDRKADWSTRLWNVLPMFLIGAAGIVFVLPRIEEHLPINGKPTNLGLPIRSYGVMMFFAVTSGVALAIYRAKKLGLHPDVIFSLATWLFIAGFLGARLFYIVQYFDSFRSPTWGEFFGKLVNITEGGLVVYGSFIFALLAYWLWSRQYQNIPALAIGDLMAPSMALGLAIGRLGCLLNGCCYGGPCDLPWAIQFPAGSPPHLSQLDLGLDGGFLLAKRGEEVIVRSVTAESNVATEGLQVGDVVDSINGYRLGGADPLLMARQALIAGVRRHRLTTAAGKEVSWPLSADRTAPSLPVHPTQIYSSINAGLICLFLLAFAPFAKRDGMLLGLCLTIYPITRFLLELIRNDEGAIWQGLTISQNVSLLFIPAILLVWWLILRQPKQRLRPVLVGE